MGLKFIPNYKFNLNQFFNIINKNLISYERLLILKTYFSTIPNTINNTINESTKFNTNLLIPKIKYNSWTPNDQAIISPINEYINTAKQSITNYLMNSIPIFQKTVTSKSNPLLHGLLKLKSRTDLIIKPADKNLGPVIMKIETYNNFCLNILNDQNTYKIMNTNTVNTTNCITSPSTTYMTTYINHAYGQLRLILNKHNHLYNGDQQKYKVRVLTKLAISLLQLQYTNKVKIPTLYILPKMHKTPISARPIIPATDSFTYATSKFLSNILTPIRQIIIPTYCKNSAQIIYDLQYLTAKPSHIIICADVKDLYPSIPIELGMTALRVILSENLDIIKNITTISLNCLLDLLHWVLTNNYVTYNNILYLQTSGTAMGTPVAVAYADFTLYYLERQSNLIKLSYYYARYIDDIFLIYDNENINNSTITNNDDNHLIQSFNILNSNIQLTNVSIGLSGIFLDLTINIDNTIHKFTTNIYQKEINKFLYLHPSSNHKKTVYKNFVIQELKRYKLFCTHEHDYQIIQNLFIQRLIQRNYNINFLNQCIIVIPDRFILLQSLNNKYKKPKPTLNEIFNKKSDSHNNNNIYFITYTPNNKIFIPWKDLLKPTTNLLQLNERLNGSLFNNNNVSYLGNKNPPNIISFFLKHNKKTLYSNNNNNNNNNNTLYSTNNNNNIIYTFQHSLNTITTTNLINNNNRNIYNNNNYNDNIINNLSNNNLNLYNNNDNNNDNNNYSDNIINNFSNNNLNLFNNNDNNNYNDNIINNLSNNNLNLYNNNDKNNYNDNIINNLSNNNLNLYNNNDNNNYNDNIINNLSKNNLNLNNTESSIHYPSSHLTDDTSFEIYYSNNLLTSNNNNNSSIYNNKNSEIENISEAIKNLTLPS